MFQMCIRDRFEDISDLDVVDTVKEAYLDMDKELEFIPKDGTYALPYACLLYTSRCV